MDKKITLALDAMGGDFAPSAVILGAAHVIAKHPGVSFLLYGDKDQIEPLLKDYPRLKARSQVVHTDEVISGDEKPTVALRRKGTSMRLAVEAVASGIASGVVSSGNTGAYMALSKILLKTIPGVSRPAISTLVPTERGRSVMLDMGANITCEASHLMQFALMGKVFAQKMLQCESPSVGILNVGVEEMKGNVQVQEAAALLKQLGGLVNFYGFIEGDDINKGTVDVVVTDGFTGNACIKTAEGISRMMMRTMKKTIQGSFLAKIAMLMALPALKKLKKEWDPASYNGAIFIGLNGVAIKSHGSAQASGFANALTVAIQMIDHGFNEQIEQDLIAARKILGDQVSN